MRKESAVSDSSVDAALAGWAHNRVLQLVEDAALGMGKPHNGARLPLATRTRLESEQAHAL